MMLQTVLTYKVYNPEKFKAQYEAEVAAKRAAKKEVKTVTVEEGGKGRKERQQASAGPDAP